MGTFFIIKEIGKNTKGGKMKRRLNQFNKGGEKGKGLLSLSLSLY
ncbi:MAG: hypothetical protein AB7T10_01740 [bacterium]